MATVVEFAQDYLVGFPPPVPAAEMNPIQDPTQWETDFGQMIRGLVAMGDDCPINDDREFLKFSGDVVMPWVVANGGIQLIMARFNTSDIDVVAGELALVTSSVAAVLVLNHVAQGLEGMPESIPG